MTVHSDPMMNACGAPIREPETGSALLLTTIVMVIIAGLGTAFLSTVFLGHVSTTVRVDRELAFMASEAGIDAALYELQTTLDQANDGIGNASGEMNGASYQVGITPTFSGGGTYVITSLGSWGGQMRRLEIVVESGQSAFTMGLFADGDITGLSNSITDSYDSSAGSYASQATNWYGPLGVNYANSGGNIATNADITLDSNVTVFGNATPGPSGSVTLHGNASVTGSTAPASQYRALTTPTYSPPVAATGSVSLSGSDTMTLGGGTYRFNELTLDSNSRLTLGGNVILYVDSNINILSNAELRLLPGATVTLHHGDGDFFLDGNGILNMDQVPASFMFYSSSDGTLEMNSNASFHGAIFAPEMSLICNSNSDTYGALVVKDALLDSNMNIHYDEALNQQGASSSGFEIKSFREISL